MTVDLHKLANTPGAGIAFRELKKQGFIDNHVDTGEVREWVMAVTAVAACSGTVKVMARNEEEAIEKATAKATGFSFDWDYDDVYDIDASVSA